MPRVERHARVVFRGRSPADREEAVAEAVATAYVAYRRLRSRGLDPARDFPSAIATFAALHVKDGRHVGGHSSSKDVLSPKAQRRHRFKVVSLPVTTRHSHDELCSEIGGQHRIDAFEERLQDDTQTPIPDQVAFRCDFPAWTKTRTRRERSIIRMLGLDHKAGAVARSFGLSPGRISQLRRDFHEDWERFCGEEVRGATRSAAA
jgi:hypothetical protein